MKKMEILVPVGTYQDHTYVSVMAEECVIVGFGKFFVHHKVNRFAPGMIDDDHYEVTEADTKCTVPESVASSRKKSINKAKMFLERRGIDEFTKAKVRAKELLDEKVQLPRT